MSKKPRLELSDDKPTSAKRDAVTEGDGQGPTEGGPTSTSKEVSDKHGSPFSVQGLRNIRDEQNNGQGQSHKESMQHTYTSQYFGEHHLLPTEQIPQAMSLVTRSPEAGCPMPISSYEDRRKAVPASEQFFSENQLLTDQISVSISETKHFYAAPVTQYDLSNASNTTLSTGEVKVKGCISNEALDSRIKLLQDVFVEVHVMEKVKQILKMYGHVTISGAPGDGKTSMALMLCEEYQHKKYQTLFVENIEDFEVDTITKLKSNLFIVFDDIFGCVTFSCNLEKVHKLFRALIDVMFSSGRSLGRDQMGQHTGQKLHVVFTSRKYNLNEGCSKLFVYKSNLFRQETILDQTREGLTSTEKINILTSFQQWSKGCDISESDINSITDLQNEVFGFPFICKLYFTTPAFQIHTVKFFKHPLTYLRGELDLIVWECSNRSAAIILLTLCGGKLDLVSFRMKKEMGQKSEKMFQAVKEIVPSCTRTDVRKELNNFNGTYCKVEHQIASFSHPSIYDAAACALGKLNIVLLLEYCTLRFMFERVRVNKSNTVLPPEPDDVTNMIYIDESLYPLVVSRLVEGIRQGHFSMTVNHPVLSDNQIASTCLEELQDVFPKLTEEKDKSTAKCFLYWASLSESNALFDTTLNHVSRTVAVPSSELSGEKIADLYDAVVICVQSGKLEFLRKLKSMLQQNGLFNMEYKTKENQTFLMIASENGHLNVFDFLLQEGAKVATTGKEGWNCLHFACESGSEKIATVILDKFPDIVNIPDDFGKTPAMICAVSDHVQLLQFLMSKGADLHITDKWNSNCLHFATYEGHLATVKMIFSMQNLDLDIDQKDTHESQSSVLIAAEKGHYNLYRLLVSKGADLSITDEDDRDCLWLASKGGNLPIVKHLLSLNIFDINRTDGSIFKSPVMIAAEEGHFDVYNLLVSKGADLSLTDGTDTDCLVLACKGGNLSIVKHLISLKTFDINRRDGMLKMTAVMVAAHKGHSDVYNLLVSEGAKLSYTDQFDNDCLMLACKGGNLSVVKHLLSLKTFDINRRGGHCSQTSVMMAAAKGYYDVYKFLVSEGADPTLRDKDNMDCLMLACENDHVSLVKYLLSLKTFNINRRGGSSNQTPVMTAAEWGHYDVYNLLVSEGADLFLDNETKQDCLRLASQGGNASIVKHLLSMKRFNVNRRCEPDNKTPLMIAAERGHEDICHLLVTEGADLSVTDENDSDCLWMACSGGNVSVVKYLLSLKTFDINRRGGPDSQTPVMLTAEGGFDDIYDIIVPLGADITLTDGNDCDCLMLASREGHLPTVKRLLSLKVFDINRKDGVLNQTAVMMAAERGSFEVFTLLVSEGADLSFIDKENRDCLMLGCKGRNVSVVEHLLSLKTFDINRRGGPNNDTPVMMVARDGFYMYHVYDLLVSAGADLSLTSEDGSDCLMLACEGGDVDIVKHLLSLKTFDINRKGGSHNKSPIMLAADNGHSDVYDLLVAEGGDLPPTDDDSSDNQSQNSSDSQSQSENM